MESFDVDSAFNDNCDITSDSSLECPVIGLTWSIQLFWDQDEAEGEFWDFDTGSGAVSDLYGEACDPLDAYWESTFDWYFTNSSDKIEGPAACFTGYGGAEMLWVQELDQDNSPFYALINVWGGTEEEVFYGFERGLILAYPE